MIDKEHVADLRLRRTYNWTLAERNSLAKIQDEKCAICRKLPLTKPLCVDHDHRYDRVYVKVEKRPPELGGYSATFVDPKGHGYGIHGPDRKELRKRAKMILRRASVRGLLCNQCNRAIQRFRDNPERMKNAAKYLEDFLSKDLTS